MICLGKKIRKICEYRRFRQLLGVNLLSAVIFSGIISPATFAKENYISPEEPFIAPPAISLTTQVSFQKPVENFSITKSFSFWHQALDLAAPEGTAIKKILGGIVERKEYGRLAYGNNLIINHGSGVKSLYAHLRKIEVNINDKVTPETIIGSVGTTGFSTGPHLHLEISENGRNLDPSTILKLK